MTFVELARRRRGDILSASHTARAHQSLKHEHTRGCRCSLIRPCIPARGKQRSPVPTTGLALMSIPPGIVPCTVHAGIDRLLHPLEAFPRPRNDA